MLQKFTLHLDDVIATLWNSSQFVRSIMVRLDQLDTYRQSALLNELYQCVEPSLYEHLA